ncbi:hypothetical protein CY34DRAFT_717841 [Suillus luteus UH-Slu-Lm8-n1]|uniref:Uncharacterized protein n=1 Tax=Suillus luteus UH-Slu-Lm8-n1 TaxID=930992 RepID=A0A0D0A514_9AGAM|nr:hypothetical protein CY34DRAFT_717841 [Suillus luteus UH-Slu-Lm8-n1]
MKPSRALLCGLAIRCRVVKHDIKMTACTWFYNTDLYQEYGLMNLENLLFLDANESSRELDARAHH